MKKTIGQIITQLRKQKGLSQEELANELYVTRQAISKWESDGGVPDIDNLKNIATYFNVSVDYLIGKEQNAEDSTNENAPINLTNKNNKTTINKNKKIIRIVISIMTAIGFGLILISWFAPLYDYFGVRRISLMNLIFDFDDQGNGFLPILCILTSELAGICSSLGSKGNIFKIINKKPTLFLVLSICGSIFFMIVAIFTLLSINETLTPNGSAVPLLIFGMILAISSGITDTIITYLLNTNKISEEKMFAVPKIDK